MGATRVASSRPVTVAHSPIGGQTVKKLAKTQTFYDKFSLDFRWISPSGNGDRPYHLPLKKVAEQTDSAALLVTFAADFLGQRPEDAEAIFSSEGFRPNNTVIASIRYSL
ncbi:MAG: hypothetical protein AAGH67_00440 [Cyanobacteria bacterium P01_H01_bin.162]